MKKKREIALNKLFNLPVIIGLFFAYVSIDFLFYGDVGLGIVVGVIALALIIAPCLATPICYLFDTDGVTLCYVFFSNERYLWENVSDIEVRYDVNTASFFRNGSVLDLLCGHVFEISGTVEGELKFYMRGYIRKSFKTKRLLEKYWDGTITGYLLEDAKEWFNKRIRKKEDKILRHFTDEAVTMEREVRAYFREIIPPYKDKARECGLELRTEYLYVTKDIEEYKSRPHKGYTYTANIEISRPGETDENRIICVWVELLYVRLGKTAYRGVRNKSIAEELESELADALNEIKEIGIDAYLEEE